MNVGDENELNEFKESLSQLDKGLKSMTAMLNKHGKGRVFFGVDDDDAVIGARCGVWFKPTAFVVRTTITVHQKAVWGHCICTAGVGTGCFLVGFLAG